MFESGLVSLELWHRFLIDEQSTHDKGKKLDELRSSAEWLYTEFKKIADEADAADADDSAAPTLALGGMVPMLPAYPDYGIESRMVPSY